MDTQQEFEEFAFNPQLEFRHFWISHGANYIFNKLREKCFGQDDAIRKASVLIYAYIRSLALGEESPRLSFMIHGESGCGKSTFAHALKDAVAPIPVHIVDASQLTTTGYKGAEVTDAVDTPILRKWHYAGIVVLDEIDKLMDGKSTTKAGENVARQVQENMLKMLDGDSVLTKDGDEIFCGRFLFIGMGAFSRLRDKEEQGHRIGFGAMDQPPRDVEITRDAITGFGESEQFVGRFVSILPFKRCGYDVYRRVAAEVIKEIRFLFGDNAITDDEAVLRSIIDEAMNSDYGCRNIRNAIWDYFLENNHIFEDEGIHPLTEIPA